MMTYSQVKGQGQWPVGSKDTEYANGRTHRTDRRTDGRTETIALLNLANAVMMTFDVQYGQT